MKTRLILLILFLLPFVAISQQTDPQGILPKKQDELKVFQKSDVQISTEIIQVDRYSNEYRISNNIPEDFPRYINTGNPKIDEAIYYDAKQEWIKKNPARFEKIKHIAF